jgi:hypothetical protein
MDVHKVLANNISKMQVITKMGLSKAVDRSVLQDDGYTQPYITIGVCFRGIFHKRMVKVYCITTYPLGGRCRLMDVIICITGSNCGGS